jgi:ABC-2 type transport system permease protein
MRYFKLIRLYFRIGVLNELEYRANFFVQIFQTVLGLLTALGGLAVIFEHTGDLGGWRSDELLALVGVYFLVGGLIGFVIQPSMQRLMMDVRTGTLDFMLTKPEDAQFIASIRQVEMWKLVDIALGVGLLVVALARLGRVMDVAQVLGFGVALLAGAAIVYSFWLMLATLVFWFVRVDNILVIFQTMYEAGRWPVTIYPGWMQVMLTFLVPVAFAVTVPSQAVVGRLTLQTLMGALGVAALMLFVSRRFWRIGIRHYSGASA